ncbi:hypothetical protein E4U43_005178 [Claviceps pusilla]|uniref:Uncharacterized protein n=1 Tax=Claviceps pusilla TaxID=123648 RepID=A0A9P7N2E6_9HYPO|nr:hypothetical protein E4U43_005178 [Claviceps pusilla]
MKLYARAASLPQDSRKTGVIGALYYVVVPTYDTSAIVSSGDPEQPRQARRRRGYSGNRYGVDGIVDHSGTHDSAGIWGDQH